MKGDREGYNKGEIAELIRVMNDDFNKVGETMASNWGDVVNTMQNEWIGPDEQDFEGKIAERLVKAYTDCEQIVKQTLENLIEVGKSWVEMQNKNRLEGDSSFSANIITSSDFENLPTINTYDIASIVKLRERAFSNSDNMGLANGASSGQTILEKINNYTDEIKSKIKSLFAEVDAAKAFLSSVQSNAIKEYITAVGNLLSAVNTDLDDMTMHLSKLAGTSYEEMVQLVAEKMGRASAQTSSLIDEM